MDTVLSNNTVTVISKRQRNCDITVIENLPSADIDRILTTCRKTFGCGGSILKGAAKPTIQLQGNHCAKIDQARETIFKGLALKIGTGR